MLDAFTAPVYATQIARFEIWLARTLRPLVSFPPPPSSPDFARHLRRVSNVVERAEKRIDDLYVDQPNRAVTAADDLDFALDAYETFLNGVADSLRGGRRVLTPVGVKQFQREAAKLERDVRDAITTLRPAIGAQPLAVPGAPLPPAPEDDAA